MPAGNYLHIFAFNLIDAVLRDTRIPFDIDEVVQRLSYPRSNVSRLYVQEVERRLHADRNAVNVCRHMWRLRLGVGFRSQADTLLYAILYFSVNPVQGNFLDRMTQLREWYADMELVREKVISITYRVLFFPILLPLGAALGAAIVAAAEAQVAAFPLDVPRAEPGDHAIELTDSSEEDPDDHQPLTDINWKLAFSAQLSAQQEAKQA
jgi:hypothetical protein